MTAFFLSALVVMAVALSVLMAGAWVVQQRTGNSGWVDTIWTFSLGLVGVVAALWPMAGQAITLRQWLIAGLVALWSLRLGSHIAARSAKITDDPRYAAFAREWGDGSPRRMFIFLQNQGFGSIPLVFSIFVAAHVPLPELRVQDYLGALICSRVLRERRWRTRSSRRFAATRRRRVRFAMPGYGRGRGTRTISSNGSDGWPIR